MSDEYRIRKNFVRMGAVRRTVASAARRRCRRREAGRERPPRRVVSGLRPTGGTRIRGVSRGGG